MSVVGRTLKRIPAYRKALAAGKAGVHDFMLDAVWPREYRKAAQAPVQRGKALFIERTAGALPDSFQLVWERLEQAGGYDLEFISLGKYQVQFREMNVRLGALVRKIATAEYVFLNDASDVVSCLPLRPETKVVQLWHACGAFKKWGLSGTAGFGKSREYLMRHPNYANLDLVTVSSPDVEWAYREAMGLEEAPGVVQALGVSRTDVFFDEGFLRESRRLVEELVPACRGKKVLLYAPTFRGHMNAAKAPDALDFAQLAREMPGGWVLLVKDHPFVKEPRELPGEAAGFVFDVSRGDIPMSRLIAAADACMTDYSSVVFEWSLLGRPISFFAYDLDEYYDERGFYYDYREFIPGPLLADTADAAAWVGSLDDGFDRGKLAAFRERFMSACDGHATDRICRWVVEGVSEAPQPVPAWKRLAMERGGLAKDISVIIPAYNAEQFIGRALDSVLSQDYPSSRMEVLVVDDCSTDGTWELLRRYERSHPGIVRVFRLPENSGNGGVPRNAALDSAAGTFVFFLDADDWLGEHAVRLMLEHAVEWGSDVLVPRMAGEGGRPVPTSMFTHDEPAVDAYRSKVMHTLGPVKLFRRSLLERWGIRFLDVLPEDSPFIVRALHYAQRISIAMDYEYYHCTYHDDNISYDQWDDIDQCLESLSNVLTFVAEHIPQPERDYNLLPRLYRRDVYRMMLAVGKKPESEQMGYLVRMRALFIPFYTPAVYENCDIERRLALDSLLAASPEIALEAVGRCMQGDLSDVACYNAEAGRAYARIDFAAGSMRLDVTRAFRRRFTFDAIEASESTVAFAGSFYCSPEYAALVDMPKVTLVARRRRNAEEAPFPCTLEKAPYDLDNPNYAARFRWSAKVRLDEVAACRPSNAASDSTEWLLLMRCDASGVRHDTRVGDFATREVARAFSGIGRTITGFEPFITEYGNFSFIQAADGSDREGTGV